MITEKEWGECRATLRGGVFKVAHPNWLFEVMKRGAEFVSTTTDTRSGFAGSSVGDQLVDVWDAPPYLTVEMLDNVGLFNADGRALLWVGNTFVFPTQYEYFVVFEPFCQTRGGVQVTRVSEPPPLKTVLNQEVIAQLMTVNGWKPWAIDAALRRTGYAAVSAPSPFDDENVMPWLDLEANGASRKV